MSKNHESTRILDPEWSNECKDFTIFILYIYIVCSGKNPLNVNYSIFFMVQYSWNFKKVKIKHLVLLMQISLVPYSCYYIVI